MRHPLIPLFPRILELGRSFKESIDTRVPSRIVPRNGSKQVRQRGLVLLIGAEHRLPLPPLSSTLGFYQHQFHSKALRYASRASNPQIIPDYCTRLFPLVRTRSVDLPGTFGIIKGRSIIPRDVIDEILCTSIWGHDDSHVYSRFYCFAVENRGELETGTSLFSL